MRQTRTDIMGMPISIEILDGTDIEETFATAFARFIEIDARFSTYKEGSEISRINRGEVPSGEESKEMQEVFALAERTKNETDGYFDMRRPDGTLDPSGIVKGWAIREVAALIETRGHARYLVDVAGDIACAGMNADGAPWSIGIRNPFDRDEVVKIIYPDGRGVATSGSYIRGSHIYDPHHPELALDEIASITVIGKDVLEADRFATAAFAMGRPGISFIEELPGAEGYAIDKEGIATMTSGFLPYTHPPV